MSNNDTTTTSTSTTTTTITTTTSTITSKTGMGENNAVYAIAIAQFLLAVLITVINTLMVAVLITTKKLRTDVTHCLLTNMWFVNLLLGVIVVISTVIENNRMTSLEKPKGTVVIVNSLITIATMLALLYARFRAAHRRNPLSLRTAVIIVSAIWTTVLTLTFIKAIVSNLNQYYDNDNKIANMQSYRNFEIAILMLLAIAGIAFFVVVLCRSIVKAKKAKRKEADKKHDGDANHLNHENQNIVAGSGGKENALVEEYENRITITVGIMLIVFIVVMLTYVIMQAVWVNNLYNGFVFGVDITASEVIICIFYLHCLINPLVLWCRDGEARLAMRQTVRCKGAVGGLGATNETATMEIQFVPLHQQQMQMQMQQQQPQPFQGRMTGGGELPPLQSTTRPFSNNTQRRPSAPPETNGFAKAPLSHIDGSDSRPQTAKFAEQTIGFVDNGELVHHM